MDNLIAEQQLDDTHCYMDNLIVVGLSQQQHDDNVQKLLDALQRRKFALNHAKTIKSVSVINVLGYRVGGGVIQHDPDRLRALKDMPVPRSPKEGERVLGMFVYYSKWIPRFADKALPLRSSSFPLETSACNAFESLKRQLEKATLLAIDEARPLVVECDASEFAISATLNQRGRPVAFLSRNVQGSERHYAPVEKEATAITEAVREWKHFLLRQPFTIDADQRSVAFIPGNNTKSKIKNNKIQSWRLELSSLSYDIKYRSGKLNVAADCLSLWFSNFSARWPPMN